ncbi:MAG: YcxB family protein [Saccharofermentans sp.]|nr:YcxB family protein [Saccharofermentans sp.]
MDEKKIFEVDSTLDKKTYRWVMTHFHEDSLILARVFWGVLPFYGVLAGIALRTIILSIILFAVGITLNIMHYLVMPRRYDKIVENFEKTGEHQNHYTFYETYLERTNVTGNYKLNYENLSALKETDDKFILYSEPNRIIVLPKLEIASKDQEFVRGLIPEANAKAYDKKHNSKKSKMIICLTVMGVSTVLLIWLMLR